ncbi:BTAD domain-containing putative transcriptional regulator [Streptomyces sp. NPDC058955]|uniref:AfsR/SARP family transcriptional regulator n=1 Tax=unclassified Streptomyces TaxID=2593676 RepID=UPI003661024C
MEVLLRTLLVRNGQVVSLDQLAQELWGAAPPVRADASLHVYVSQLRKILNKLSLSGDCIATRSPGYVLNLGRDELDLNVFTALSDKGRLQMSMGDHAAAAESLTRALALWREPVHASSFEGPIIQEFANGTEELRVECVELLARSLLASDQAREAIRILYSLTAEYPLREDFYALLMEALSRSGRRADALNVYQAARKALREELGLEPCRFLQETQEFILNDRLDELQFLRTVGGGKTQRRHLAAGTVTS